MSASLCLRSVFRAPVFRSAPFVSRGVVSVASADGSLRPLAEQHLTAPELQSTLPSALLRKQLLYRSKQRGWLELDLIMGTWAERNLGRLSEDELQQYEAVVRRENPDLMKWLVERVAVPADADNAVMQQLISYAHGSGKTWIRKKGNQS